MSIVILILQKNSSNKSECYLLATSELIKIIMKRIPEIRKKKQKKKQMSVSHCKLPDRNKVIGQYYSQKSLNTTGFLSFNCTSIPCRAQLITNFPGMQHDNVDESIEMLSRMLRTYRAWGYYCYCWWWWWWNVGGEKTSNPQAKGFSNQKSKSHHHGDRRIQQPSRFEVGNT